MGRRGIAPCPKASGRREPAVPGYHQRFLVRRRGSKSATQGGNSRLAKTPTRSCETAQVTSTAAFRKAQVAEFTPFAGLISSQTKAERIVEACK